MLTWLAAVIRLNPLAAARPYLAYEPELMGYFRDLAQRVLQRLERHEQGSAGERSVGA
ncbi:hypothetical protein AB0M02_17890 [Actinoplanes sp. NPDC051861]|uniref:hypothetical protein n=1 Tax=Actinoplanes sp. NPDC051861 TaxID=3155170 RepID=UPI0034215504